ncbi:MAG: hypothetical protein NZM04_10690 [Methylacidiphilales bacterium]|nr:hypothetical protein [Candidatus Methylacidiphilales bacterium]MDW8349090.1 hypothetical protein [Verrucomicrobiae bacterium]
MGWANKIYYLAVIIVWVAVNLSWAEQLNLDVEVERKRKSDQDQSDTADFDDRQQYIRLGFKIKNNEFDDHKGIKAKVWIIGEAYDSNIVEEKNTFVVLSKHEFDLDLKGGEETAFATDGYTVKYDSTLSARYGATYYCYALELVNAQNQVVFRKTDKPSFIQEEDFEKLDSLGIRKAFDKKLRPLKGVKILFPE